MGDLSFQNVIDAKLFGPSSIAKSISRLTREFPQPVEARENSWFSQPFFSNSNIVTKVQNRRGRGFELIPVSQTYLNLPPYLTINLNELYDGGRFIEEPALEDLIRVDGNINYRIGENTRIQLISIFKYILGNGSHHDGVKKSLYPTPNRYSLTNISNLIGKIKKGSQKFRKVLTRNQDFITNSRLEKWRKTLECNELDGET